VAVGVHELAEGLAGDLASVEEEVQVHGHQLPLGHALAEHEQHGAHHVPQPPRHVQLHLVSVSRTPFQCDLPRGETGEREFSLRRWVSGAWLQASC
jgi:hypothetical protein